MKSLAWKLATLAAVIGIGFLVLLQAQRGMNQAMLNKQAAGQAAATAPTTPHDDMPLEFPGPAPKPKAGAETAQADPIANPSSQGEPQFGSEPKPTAVEPPKADRGSKVVQTADTTPSPAETPSGPSTAGDPFGDFNDAKHPNPGSNAGKSPTPALPAVTPAGDMKLAKEADQPAGKASPTPAKSPAMGEKTPAVASTQTSAGGPPLLDLNAPPGQSEPGESPIPQTAAAPKNEPKHESQAVPKVASKDKDANSGPQLFGPSGGPELPTASPPATKTAETNANSTPPAPGVDAGKKNIADGGTADGGKKDASGAGQVKGNSEPAPFPSLDDEPATNKPASGMSAPKNDPVAQNTPHPDPFPGDQTKEVPLAKPAEPKMDGSKTADAGPKSKGPEPALDAAITGPKMAELPTPGSTAVPRSSAEKRPDAKPDVQGDGTVSEQAPLGPQRPQLNIEKIAPQNALIGQPLIYTILVKNVGNSAAHDVVVEDRIPKGTTLSGTIPRAELSGKKLIWRFGTMRPGDEQKISIKVTPVEAGEIGSVATVNFVSEAAAETVVTAPRLEFELSAPKGVKLGAMVPFHFKVRNIGTGEARGVSIRDVLPDGLSHSQGKDLEYVIGRLPAGKEHELTLELLATKVGTTVNRALLVGEGGLSVRAEAAVEISGSKLVVTRNGPPRRYLGRAAIYSTSIRNDSKYDVQGVVAVETVPPGMEFAGASHGGQFNEGTRTIAWRIDRMGPNQTSIVKSKLIPKATGPQMSTVRVTVPNGEPVEASTETTVEGFAALGVDIAGADGPVDVGEKVTLRVNARNKGTIAATNVLLTVDVPEQMHIVSVRGPGTHTQSGNQVQFGPIATLEGRTLAVCEVVLQAAKRGDCRIHVSLRADQVDRALTREESVLVLSESAEAAASR
jgi:uncharacterized repeat protein (TIGR01451 family)